MKLTLTESQAASTDLNEESLEPDELTELLTHPQVGEKDGYALIPALFRPCPAVCWNHGHPKKRDCGGNKPHRHRNNVQAVAAFCGDVDDITEKEMQERLEFLKAKGWIFYAWETYSHDPEAVARGEAKGRYRILIPFAKQLEIANPEQWSKGAWPLLVRKFGLTHIDAACKDPSRLYYLPRMPEGAVREAVHFPGRLFDVHAELGPLDKIVPPVPLNPPMSAGEAEDPSRPVDLEALKKHLTDTRNPTTKDLATKAVKGELITGLPGEARQMSRHEAWWLLTGRLSIVAEDWMSTEALLEVLRPSHMKEREASPEDFTPWDDDRDSVVEMLLAQRASAPTRRSQYQAERQAKSAVARNAIDKMLKARGRPGLSTKTEPSDDPDEDAPVDSASVPLADAWTYEDVKAQLEIKHSAAGAETYPGTLHNISRVLTYSPDWAGAFRLNMLSNEMELWPCKALHNTEVIRFSDSLITSLRLALNIDEHFPMRATHDEVVKAAAHAAEQRPYEPVQDYLSPLKWDGTKRLETWLVDYMNARVVSDEGEDLRPYLTAIGMRWMISAVARAFEPGCQADNMLQIEGAQGMRKSTALSVLGGPWYMESTSDFESKDTAVMMATTWIVELGELTSFDRASVAMQKSFLSRRSDNIVRKYERFRSELFRRCVFAGTTNEEEYLTDPTGNRRHWAFRMEDREIDIDKLKRDREQLFAEAVHLYRAGEKWHLTKEERALASREAAKRVLQSDMIDDMVESWFKRTVPEKRPKGILPVDIARRVLSDDRGVTKKTRIVLALKRLGFVNKAMRIDGELMKRWATPVRLLDAPFEGGQREETLEKIANAKKVTAEA